VPPLVQFISGIALAWLLGSFGFAFGWWFRQTRTEQQNSSDALDIETINQAILDRMGFTQALVSRAFVDLTFCHDAAFLKRDHQPCPVCEHGGTLDQLESMAVTIESFHLVTQRRPKA
jgi:hypothetical protein